MFLLVPNLLDMVIHSPLPLAGTQRSVQRGCGMISGIELASRGSLPRRAGQQGPGDGIVRLFWAVARSRARIDRRVHAALKCS